MKLSRGARVLMVVAAGAALGLLGLSAAGPKGRRLHVSEALAADPIVVKIPTAGPDKAADPPAEPGPEVPQVASPWLDDIARASLSPMGAVIYVNPIRCKELGPDVCGFFLEHEQGHVRLGHGAARYTTFIGGAELAEDEADCWAARHATLVQVNAAIAFFSRQPWVDHARGAHGTGAERAERIRTCRDR